jgi:hypothetical protein
MMRIGTFLGAGAWYGSGYWYFGFPRKAGRSRVS